MRTRCLGAWAAARGVRERVAVCVWPSWCATRALRAAWRAVLGTDTIATAPLEPLEVMITKYVCEQVV